MDDSEEHWLLFLVSDGMMAFSRSGEINFYEPVQKSFEDF